MSRTKTEYRKYINSPAWQARRKEFLKNEEFCAKCYIPRWLAEIAYDQDFHVHHLSYERIGKEQDSDLQALCRRCHDIETFDRSELPRVKTSICTTCKLEHYDPRSDRCLMCSAIFGAYSSFTVPLAANWRDVLQTFFYLVRGGKIRVMDVLCMVALLIEAEAKHPPRPSNDEAPF